MELENLSSERVMLNKISVYGYKSIKGLNDFKLNNVNVLIGINGAGKSNIISIFKLLNHIYNRQLQSYSLKSNIDSMFYMGTKNTKSIVLEFEFNKNKNKYKVELKSTDNNSIVVAQDVFDYHLSKHLYKITENKLESDMVDAEGIIESKNVAFHCLSAIKQWKVYHFHDTGDDSPMKRQCANNDNLIFKPDGSNLAAYIRMIYKKYRKHYNFIVSTIQDVAPYFGGFIVRDDEYIQLEWFDKSDPDTALKAHMLSDGTLRFICLTVLLLQPLELMPDLILVDEPELGLHPYAIEKLVGLIRRLDNEDDEDRKQFIISTQSVELLNYFSADEIVVVEHKDNQSQLERLDNEKLKIWLEDYSLGEVWNSNIIGGRP